jgi:pimeloyl-ACP methyl ester carboxylesterase
MHPWDRLRGNGQSREGSRSRVSDSPLPGERCLLCLHLRQDVATDRWAASTLHLEKAAMVGWSDGACTALILARQVPARVAGVFFFACNMDPSGTKTIEMGPILERCLKRHKKDYR